MTSNPPYFTGLAAGIPQSAKPDDEDVKDNIKSVDFGVALGGGADFTMEQDRIPLDIRYTLGLTSIDDVGDADDVKNGNLSFTPNYAF